MDMDDLTPPEPARAVRGALKGSRTPTAAAADAVASADAAGPNGLRPRERLRDGGAEALSDAELLALVLGSGVAGRSASRTGRQLARHHPSELAGWPLARWLAVAGVGPARAAALGRTSGPCAARRSAVPRTCWRTCGTCRGHGASTSWSCS
jgi:hypothetical protein